MNTFDVIVLVLLVLGGITGFQKGLLTGLSRFIGKIAAIGIALIFHTRFLQTVEPVLGLKEKIEPGIRAFLAKILESKMAGAGRFGSSNGLVHPVLGEATAVLTDYVLKIGSLLAVFILATVVVNLIIAVLITPLAKTLDIVDRGGGLAFGVFSSAVVLCLVVGLIGPFLATAGSGYGFLDVRHSLLYPWLIRGYGLLSGCISALAGDVLTNPLDSFPVFKGTPV